MVDLTVEELQTQLEEAKKKTATALSENKTLIETRDGLKTKLATIETEKEAEARRLQEEQGQFKELHETAQAKVLELTGQVESGAEERTSLEAQIGIYKERDKAELAVLIENVPEEFKAMVGDETLGLPKQLELARGLVKTKLAPPAVRIPGGPPVDATLAERHAQAIKDGDMALAISLKNEMFKKE